MLRDLTDDERTLIRSIANLLDCENRNRLLLDLANARAEPVLDDGSLIRFHLKGYRRGPYKGQHTYPFEATLTDADGAPVDVLLFADPANRLFELEFLRWADGPLLGPDWTTLEIIPGRSPS